MCSMHRGMCSGAGNRVFRAAERLIRACNPFEASPSRLWSLLTLIPQRIRRAVTAAAAACYTYTLAQFLAMVCLLLASAFVQLTMKFWDVGAWHCPITSPECHITLLTNSASAVMVMSTLLGMVSIIGAVWRLAWDSVMGFKVIRDAVHSYLHPVVTGEGASRSYGGHAVLFAFLTTPALSLILILSPSICASLGRPLVSEAGGKVWEDMGAAGGQYFSLITVQLMKYACGVDPLYRTAVIHASVICWIQWLGIVCFLEPDWRILVRGRMRTALGWGIILLSLATVCVCFGGFVCDTLPIFSWSLSDFASELARLQSNALTPEDSQLIGTITSSALSLASNTCSPGSLWHWAFVKNGLSSYLRSVFFPSSLPTGAADVCVPDPLNPFSGPSLSCPKYSDAPFLLLLLKLAWLAILSLLVAYVLVKGRARRAGLNRKESPGHRVDVTAISSMIRVTQLLGLGVSGWLGTLAMGVSYGYALLTTVGMVLPLFYTVGILTRGVVLELRGPSSLKGRANVVVLSLSLTAVVCLVAHPAFVAPAPCYSLFTVCVWAIGRLAKRLSRRSVPPTMQTPITPAVSAQVSAVSEGGKGSRQWWRDAAATVKQSTETWVKSLFVKTLLFLVVLTSAISITSNMQQSGQFSRPPTIQYSHAHDAIFFSHALAVKLKLIRAPPGGGWVPPQDHHSFRLGPGGVEGHLTYGICGQKWYGLDIVDYSLLSLLAYLDPKSGRGDVEELLSALFPEGNGSAFRIGYYPHNITPWGPKPNATSGLNATESHTQPCGHWFELVSDTYNLSVVVVAGTDLGKVNDMLEDIKMWIEPVLLKCLSIFFPTVRLWPQYLISLYVETMHSMMALFGFETHHGYYKDLIAHINSIKDRNVVVTGHSLGGGIAHIAGAFTRRISVTFSPPGILYSRRKFIYEGTRVQSRDAYHQSVSVIPDLDAVPLIDRQASLRQQIRCDNHNSMFCHAIEVTACNLLQSCGDHRGRFAGCEVWTGPHAILPVLAHYAGRFLTIADVVFVYVALMIYGFLLVPVLRTATRSHKRRHFPMAAGGEESEAPSSTSESFMRHADSMRQWGRRFLG